MQRTFILTQGPSLIQHRTSQRKSQRRVVCASAASADLSSVVIPNSREEVIEGAGLAVRGSLEKAAPTRKKSFKRTQAAKLAVEISIADESPESVTTLIAGLLDPLDSGVRGNCKVAFYDIQTALIASEQLRDEVLSVQDFQPSDISGVLFVVGVPTGQEEEAASLLKWRGSIVWVSLDMNSLAYKPTQLRQSFQTVYAFEPFAARGLVRTTEGLLLKQPASGDKKAPWLIFKKAWGEFKVIGKTPARPTASDIELALYNSSARESPITQGIKAIRGLASKSKGSQSS